MGNVFFEITVVFCIAAFFVILFRFLKQPIILAYIFAGIVLGSVPFFRLQNIEALSSFSEIGITLLLFLLALELRLKGLLSIGRMGVAIGILQVVITGILSFGVGFLLGFSPLLCFYLAILLTFSSTIAIVKLLSDKKDLSSLHGKITIVILLLQDFFAIFALLFLSASGVSNTFSVDSFGLVILKGGFLFLLTLIATLVLPKILNGIARSEESLFIFSLAWAFGISALVSSPLFGFPIEIGGFVAGIGLSTSFENFQIASRLKGLRDFFVIIFFVMLGVSMNISDVGTYLIPLVVIVLFVILVKPFVVFLTMTQMGYGRRTAFFSGFTLGQISEFSLIILFVGLHFGHISPGFASLITAAAIVTFVTSSYCISYENFLYKHVSKYLVFFERKKPISERNEEDLEEIQNHVILVGANRTGKSILDALLSENEKVLVVDFDPDIVAGLRGKGVSTLFGDISDMDIHDKAGLMRAKLIISTVSDLEDNLNLLKFIQKENRKAKIIVLATEVEEARELYEKGADYVILPHIVGGRHIAKLIKEDKLDSLSKFKEKDLRDV